MANALVRPDWLARHVEKPLDPAQPIIDAHHHLYERPGLRYLLDDYLADLRTGHDVRATIFVQARASYRPGGSEALRPVGETEFAVRAAAAAHGSGIDVAAGIIGYANLGLGDAVAPILEAHLEAGGGRFRGIRQIAAWDADASLLNPVYPTTEEMLDSPDFRRGLGHLRRLALAFDAWVYAPQLPKLAALARALPDLRIVVDHCGGVVGIGAYRADAAETFARWRGGIRSLAECPNVLMKLGGLGMSISGFGFGERERPPSSADLEAAWKPWIETCIEAFGPRRCMAESNFPADKAGHSYAVGWNAMKRLAAGASAEEREDLFWRTAARAYRLDISDIMRKGDTRSALANTRK